MQLQDNNMDDLFRKAAADYPLRTDNDDWDSVAGKLADGTTFGEGSKAAGAKSYRILLLLLMLVPLGIGVYIYFSINKKGEVVVADGKTNIAQQNNIVPQKKTLLNTSATNPNTIITNNITKPLSTLPQDVPANDPVANNNISTRTMNEQRTEENNANDDKPLPAISLNSNSSVEKHINNNNGFIENSSSALLLSSSGRPLERNSTVDKVNSLFASSDKKDSTTATTKIVAKNTDSSLPAKNKKKTVSSNTKQHFFYAGVLGGIDASTVKLQSINGAGYNVGLLAGYRLSNQWSVEAGILWDNKKYYTTGKYFNTTKANLPTGIQIQDMNGNCNMFEIPIDVKYDFVKKGSGHFFVTGGLSSYIMKKEAYNYSAVYYGQSYNDYRSYNNSSRNWFSIAQFSAGYEKQLGKKYNFRIEPYLKLPLQGLGIGSLPITSMGLNIGLTRSFH